MHPARDAAKLPLKLRSHRNDKRPGPIIAHGGALFRGASFLSSGSEMHATTVPDNIRKIPVPR